MVAYLLHPSDPLLSPAVAAEPDALLVVRAQADCQAFAPLYLRYVEEISRFCRVRLGDAELARDATQQIFARALAGLPHYQERGQFRAWLYTIARHVLLNVARDRPRTLTLESIGETADPSATPEEAATRAMEHQALLAAVARLPDDQRLAIELRLAGLRGWEVATAMGRSHDVVRKLQLRALKALRTALGARHPWQEDSHAL